MLGSGISWRIWSLGSYSIGHDAHALVVMPYVIIKRDPARIRSLQVQFRPIEDVKVPTGLTHPTGLRALRFGAHAAKLGYAL